MSQSVLNWDLKPVHDYCHNYKPKQGDTVVDVGANEGVFTKYALELGASKIIAVEPSPLHYERLKTRYHKDKRVNVIGKAAWHSKTRLNFTYTNSEHDMVVAPEVSYLIPMPYARGITTVDADTLDNILAKINHVALLKVDVEGAELAVLLGARLTLQHTSHVALAIYPYDNHAQVHNVKAHKIALRRVLETYGFHVEEVDGNYEFKEQVMLGDKP